MHRESVYNLITLVCDRWLVISSSTMNHQVFSTVHLASGSNFKDTIATRGFVELV